jgi:hypothetical protein
MKARLRTTFRIGNRLFSWVTALLTVLVLAAGCALYLAVNGKSLPTLRILTAAVGRVVVGQRTESLALRVRVMPATGQLAGTATLTVRSLENNRRRFYFLLNQGLHLRQVRTAGPDRPAGQATAHQLWLLTIVDVGAPVPKDTTLQLTFDYDGTPALAMFGTASGFVRADAVLLNVDAFWYPTDVQGFCTADVSVTLPSRMNLVDNGAQPSSVQRGNEQDVRWHSDRAIAGLSLVAGPYALTTRESGGTTYRVYLPRDVQLDTARLLDLMRDANRILSDRYGASGFTQLTLFVSRDLRRGFNDGSGLMGLPLRDFRAGDYGFAAIAHEIAHNWWGAGVSEKWLVPGTGGEWIVEGFAEFSSLLAAEAEFGTAALTRRLAGEFFDPTHQRALATMSVLDNALAGATAHDTIYRKGAYVAMMLRWILGDETYSNGLRQFLERFRYQQVTDGDLQRVLEEVSRQDLGRYFTDWVRSDRLADLSLDGSGQTDVVVHNSGSAQVPGAIDLWTFKKNGGEPTRRIVHVGDTVSLDSASEYAVLDPLLAWADVFRQNNRYPRRTDPIYVGSSAGGTIAVTEGEPFPWVRATVSRRGSNGRTEHTWDFERGLVAPPSWSPDGARLIVSSSDARDSLPAIVTLDTGGARHTIGHGSTPAAAPDGSIYAGKYDRIVRVAADGHESTLVQRGGESLDAPLPSPDGTSLVYTAARGNRVEVRQVRLDGSSDRFVVSWDRDRMLYRWSPDGTRLYAIVAGEWDWQIWEIPLATEPIRVLVRDAAAIADLALSPDGGQLAFTAAPSLDYPATRRQLYLMHLADGAVRPIDLPGTDLTNLAWTDADSVLVVAAAAGGEMPWLLPATRTLKRVRPTDGRVEDVQ